MTTHALTEAAPTVEAARPARRVLLKLSGEVFGGGKVGVDPDVVRGIARQIAAAVREGIQVAVVVGRRQLLPRRGAAAEGHGPLAGRLHRHARHRDELPGPAGLPREGGHRHPRAERHHDGPGRRALHPAPRHPAPREGPGRHLRCRRRDAVLLHRHGQRPARPGVQVRRGADEQERGRRGLRLRPPHQPRRRKLERVSFEDALRSGLRVVDAAAFSLCMDNGLPMVVFGMEGDGNITRALLGERIGTLVSAA